MTRVNITPRQYDFATLLLRLVFGGFMLMNHGWPKLQLLLTGDYAGFPDPLGLGAAPSLYLAIFAEVVCAALVLIGLKTRWAALPLIFTMFVAAFVVHATDPIGRKEMALLYLFGYTVIALLGAGRYAVDEYI